LEVDVEDLDILFEDDIEERLLTLVRRGWPESMFVKSATALLGDNWRKDGKKILEENGDAKVLEQFQHYADKSPTTSD
jgi:hypothetical protein